MNNESEKEYKVILREGHCIKVKDLSQEQISSVIKRFYHAGCENSLHIIARTASKEKSELNYYIWHYKGLIQCNSPAHVDADYVELSYEEIMEELN